MHFDLKSISTDAVPKALEKAERYRLLNEPSLAESIAWTFSRFCRHINRP